jgi:plastocyanin
MLVIRNAAVGGVALLLSLGVVAQVHTFAAAPATTSRVTMTKTVNVRESNNRYAFTPAKINVKAGTTVRWKNGTDAAHTVTGKGSWASYNKPLASGKTVSYTFKKAGTYKYYCTIHPYMTGTVTVSK